MKVITFDEWKALKVEALGADYKPEECDECDGEGVRECDLGHEHDCEDCDGTGKFDKRDEFKQSLYQQEVWVDVLNACKWRGRYNPNYFPDFAEPPVIAPVSIIKDRRLDFVAIGVSYRPRPASASAAPAAHAPG